MNLLQEMEHLNCFNYGKKEHQDIELVRFREGEKRELFPQVNEIVLFIEGHIVFRFEDLPDYDALKETLAFLPTGRKYQVESLEDSLLVVFRIRTAIKLCDNLPLEKLFARNGLATGDYPSCIGQFICELEIRRPLGQFLDGLINCINDGIFCRAYYEMKTKELLFLLRIYYSKGELYDFFRPVLSLDTAFSEYVRLRWQLYPSIKELAASMNLSHKQFYSRFISVFGKSPRSWMLESKTPVVLGEIVSSEKPFKQIAHENGFSSDVQLIRFCRRTLNATPTELRRKNLTFPESFDRKKVNNDKS